MVMQRVRRLVVALGGGVLALVASAPAAADDAFARITTLTGTLIPGDQPAIPGIANSKDTVQVFGTIVGLESSTAIVEGGGVQVGQVSARPVVITKRIDRASPRLLRAAFTQEQINVDIVWVMDVAGVKKQSVSVRLEGAIITRIEASATLSRADAANYEDVSLVYGKLIQTVPTIDATGAVTGTTIICLNVVQRRMSPTTSC